MQNDGHKSLEDKAWNIINIMRRLKYVLDLKALEIIYISFIRSILEHGDVIWDNFYNFEKFKLERKNETARIVSGCTKYVSIEELLHKVGCDLMNVKMQIPFILL